MSAPGGGLTEREIADLGEDRHSEHATAAVTTFVAEVRALALGSVPVPSPEVAMLLDGVAQIGGSRRRDLWRTARRLGIVAATAAAAATTAAAGHNLPAPAQRVVSNVVNDLTPFHLDPPRQIPATPATPATQGTQGTPADPDTRESTPSPAAPSPHDSSGAPEPADGNDDGTAPGPGAAPGPSSTNTGDIEGG